MAVEEIGRYPVVKEIGRGGFAEVYLAEDLNLDAPVAIKSLSSSHSGNPEIVARFIAEARVMRRLAAPGLVSVYDSGDHDGRPYFVMEYCERGTLEERINQLGRPLTVAEGHGLAAALAGALSGVHRAEPPVVHRDIKPGNLLIRHTPRNTRPPVGQLLGADEELILGDFGLAKVVDTGATKLSMIAYTRGYAAPEQVRGNPAIGPSADVYAASAVVASAVSGVEPRPVLGRDDRAFEDDALRACGSLRHGIERGLAFEVDDRPADIDRWLDAFDQADETETTKPLWRIGAMVLLALLAIAVVFGLRSLLATNPILGPAEGFVGDEVAFAVPSDRSADIEVISWEVNDMAAGDQAVLTFRPQDPGEVRIVVVIAERGIQEEMAFTFQSKARQVDSRIEGPGHLAADEPTSLRLVDGSGEVVDSELTWTVEGDEVNGPLLEFTPITPGLLEVNVSGGDGVVTRLFTVD